MGKWELIDPVEGFEECTDKGQEEAGKEPAHDLCIDVVLLAGLPVGIDAQPAEYARDGTDDKDEVGKGKIPAVHLAGGAVEFVDPGLGDSGNGQDGHQQGNRDP
ncbi:hypothetical protein FM107_03335 [Sphingobacterium sp. JB170]|nr:hypothetical protein FM107_03335 [Sphingobacterium sp. JB170]